MTDFRLMLADLRRPRLLIRAARYGVGDYCRDRDLARIMATADPLPPERALPHLLSEEARLEEDRRCGGAGYSIARHIEVLIALLAEASLLRRQVTA